ncbi:hypothetical protein DSC45_04565 [Streptomyces sp. YIM 130001]|uniref:DUF2087 domain-containing protein n=1 Tax=Streptomyces sp. YIM 130001 TaxID=2259644 RepID=UPI000E658939|nr:DUF2087 domain-containing protein [Streptomyces sp. YIM 130001]RII20479.1 hypothetical protein DSC45_04565 [Streptomyces sp. YIM 130001]
MNDVVTPSRAATLLDLVGAPGRLKLLATVLESSDEENGRSLTAISEMTGLDRMSLMKELMRLSVQGLISLDDGRVTANLSPLRDTARAMDSEFPVTVILEKDPELVRFFRHGRLVRIPENFDAKKRVADILVCLLPEDRELTEAEVNHLLGQVHDDYAAVRRLLADLGLITRNGSQQYRRARSVGG